MPDEESPVISVKNLEKIYTGGVHAVKDVSFDVLSKQVVVIIGSSNSMTFGFIAKDLAIATLCF